MTQTLTVPNSQPVFSTLPDSVEEQTSKRKVLLFYQDFGQMGGIEKYLLQVGQALAGNNLFEPVFVCSAGTRLYDSLQNAGLKVYGLSSHSVFSKSFLRSLDMSSLLQFKRILDREKPDIVNAHIGLLETLLPKLWGYPVVFTFHGYGSLYSVRFTQNPLKRLFKAVVKELFQRTAKGVDRLLIVSQAEQVRLAQEGFLPTVSTGEVMHNGVSVSEIRQAVAETDENSLKLQLNLPLDSRIITFINRLDDNKNPCHFMALAKRFAKHPDFQDCHFLIAGDGPLKPQIQEAASWMSNVHYLGYRDDIPSLLAITDVLIYPALAEGFGLGLVEAMAAGVPCIAYASEGATEILDTPETRFALVPINQLDALSEKLEAVLSLPELELANWQSALTERAKAFDSIASVQNLQTVYQQLTPKISILLPVYNGADCVLKAVRSVLSQSYPHWELIVIDDGSTDATLVTLAEIDDARVRVFSRSNQGVAAARNFGFTQSTGDYIAFIDADDVWLSNKLAEEVRVIRAHTQGGLPTGLVYSSYFAVDDSGRLLNLPGIYRENGDLSEAVLEHEGIFLPSTALVHRTVFETVGGFQTACYHEDRVFFIQACQQFPAYAAEKRLVLYRQSLSGRCRSVLKNYEDALEAELSIVTTLQGSLSQHQLALLSIRQRRNLIFRFLMYNYLEQACQLIASLDQDERVSLERLLTGKKGQLAALSVQSRINFLCMARLLTQWTLKRIPIHWLVPVPVLITKEESLC